MISLTTNPDNRLSVAGVSTVYPAVVGSTPLLRIFCGTATVDLTDRHAVEHFFREVSDARDEYLRLMNEREEERDGKE